MRVLVLDDQPDKGLLRVLRTMGAVPLIARTEEEAIVIINAGIDAAIVDMQLELPLWNLCRAVGEYCTYEWEQFDHANVRGASWRVYPLLLVSAPAVVARIRLRLASARCIETDRSRVEALLSKHSNTHDSLEAHAHFISVLHVFFPLLHRPSRHRRLLVELDHHPRHPAQPRRRRSRDV